ncbi:PD-(D/E)XK motif protein [Micrococcus luteus]|uniref:PD-(D/E)XK motif protein n=1 Tax=Micrococcus luteus TaxID=1270 RepID=UPI002102347F|nr:PD-(D/E)XK motif protein [Micrococcus luteus]UTX34438.1 PD-(D/E)XK motif protein [Micrococcus luteus]
MPSYEQVLATISATPTSDVGNDRDIQWLTTAEVVGVARNHLGHVELFLAGEALRPRTTTLRSAIHHHSWTRSTGDVLEANRLLFPPVGHFDQIAALIATELLREGATTDLARAFALTEPIIELAMERMELSEAALLGLAGELLLLDALVRRIDDAHVSQLVAAWDGWRRSARDLTWGGMGVEIKTTTRATSSHVVQGTHQVEPINGDGSTVGEDALLLVSVGLQVSAPSANSFTVPQLVARIADRLAATGNGSQADQFLMHVAEYGAETGLGYQHPAMADDAPFTTTFTPAFVRAYDMGDPAVQVIRRDDVMSHQHVDANSLSFRIDLPATISLDNPADGVQRVAQLILRQDP